ncbi:alpha/beta-hydrolase [Trametes sanguinea]|nr:alpha/beta-hydrolase [Trametes sanguinea]
MAPYTVVTVAPTFPTKRIQQGLRLVAKRYIPESSNRDGYTLLFFHCAGSHKEAWEPTIESVLPVIDPAAGLPIVREAWSFDMQNHGESATWNLEALKTLDHPLTVEDWADGFKAFIASGALDGHKLICVGHSLGASAMILATYPDDLPPVNYTGIVLVEDALLARAVYAKTQEENHAQLKTIFEAVTKRRDLWNSREEAQRYFEKRIPWVMWDKRVLQLYVRHGLREFDVEEGGKKASKVTLACPKEQERFAYHHIAPHFRVGDRLPTLDPSIPIHFIHGERNDVIPEYMHDSIVALPKKVASVQNVPDAGHFVVQENPDELAKAINNVLISMSRSRLKANL